MKAFVKEPDEAFTISIDFDGALPDGAALASGTLSAIEEGSGTDVTATVLGSTSSGIDGTEASLDVLDGVNGVNYILTAEMTLDTGAILVENIRMQVRSQL